MGVCCTPSEVTVRHRLVMIIHPLPCLLPLPNLYWELPSHSNNQLSLVCNTGLSIAVPFQGVWDCITAIGPCMVTATMVHPDGSLYHIHQVGLFPPLVESIVVWGDPASPVIRPDPNHGLVVHEIYVMPWITTALTDGELSYLCKRISASSRTIILLNRTPL